MIDRPPCWPAGQPCPNPCAKARYDQQVHNLSSLHGAWQGWRLAGRDLVAPDGQRLAPERLLGLMWREANEQRLARAIARHAAVQRRQQLVKVVVVDLATWQRQDGPGAA